MIKYNERWEDYEDESVTFIDFHITLFYADQGLDIFW